MVTHTRRVAIMRLKQLILFSSSCIRSSLSLILVPFFPLSSSVSACASTKRQGVHRAVGGISAHGGHLLAARDGSALRRSDAHLAFAWGGYAFSLSCFFYLVSIYIKKHDWVVMDQRSIRLRWLYMLFLSYYSYSLVLYFLFNIVLYKKARLVFLMDQRHALLFFSFRSFVFFSLWSVTVLLVLIIFFSLICSCTKETSTSSKGAAATQVHRGSFMIFFFFFCVTCDACIHSY